VESARGHRRREGGGVTGVASDGGRQLVRVWTGSRRSRKCVGCGAPITFVRVVATGRWMPFSSDPLPVSTMLDQKTGRAVDSLDAAEIHFRACPRADALRRRRRRAV
jgi:hypothetical protein